MLRSLANKKAEAGNHFVGHSSETKFASEACPAVDQTKGMAATGFFPQCLTNERWREQATFGSLLKAAWFRQR